MINIANNFYSDLVRFSSSGVRFACPSKKASSFPKNTLSDSIEKSSVFTTWWNVS